MSSSEQPCQNNVNNQEIPPFFKSLIQGFQQAGFDTKVLSFGFIPDEDKQSPLNPQTETTQTETQPQTPPQTESPQTETQAPPQTESPQTETQAPPQTESQAPPQTETPETEQFNQTVANIVSTLFPSVRTVLNQVTNQSICPVTSLENSACRFKDECKRVRQQMNVRNEMSQTVSMFALVNAQVLDFTSHLGEMVSEISDIETPTDNHVLKYMNEMINVSQDLMAIQSALKSCNFSSFSGVELPVNLQESHERMKEFVSRGLSVASTQLSKLNEILNNYVADSDDVYMGTITSVLFSLRLDLSRLSA